MKNYSLNIGFRSLVLRRKQYAPLFLVCMLGMSLSIFALFVLQGMLSSLSLKAKIYYGGDYQFMGGSPGLDLNEPNQFIEKLKTVFPSDTVITPRFDYGADSSALYFEGTGVRMRVVKGCDFRAEKELFNKFTYVAGNASDMAGTNGILLSRPIAEMLCVSVGDEVTFMLRTTQGWLNTVSLVVKGIFQDSSLFGMYTSYVDIDTLRNSVCYPSNCANRISVFFPGNPPSKQDTAVYQAALEKIFPMFPQTESKQRFYDKLLPGLLPNPTYALIKLSANMNDVNALIFAMKTIIAFIIVILSLIITVGVSNIYRVIVMKRINEIGIYMALGMSRPGISRTLLSETFVLLFTGCLSGFGLALVLSKVISRFDFSSIPAFDIFLTDGKLVASVSGGPAFLLSVAIIGVTGLAVTVSVRKIFHTLPAEALGAVV